MTSHHISDLVIRYPHDPATGRMGLEILPAASAASLYGHPAPTFTNRALTLAPASDFTGAVFLLKSLP